MTDIIVTEEMIKKINPLAKTDVVPFINKYAPKYNITSERRMAAFIATTMVESANYIKYVESMNYRAARLLAVFPKTVKNIGTAQRLVAAGQRGIANFVYGLKNGNRGRDTDDGWNYRGRGAIQITGRTNYQLVSQSTGVDYMTNPDLLSTPEHAILSAMDWWKRNGCNELADTLILNSTGTALKKVGSKYSTSPSLVALRKRVNGATMHIQDVGYFFDKALSVF